MRYTVSQVVELLSKFPPDRVFGIQTFEGWVDDIEFLSGALDREAGEVEITAHGSTHDCLGVTPSQ